MSYDDDEESLEYGCGFALGALLGPLAVIPLLLLGGGLVAAVAMLLQALCLWILSLPVMLAAIVVAVFDSLASCGYAPWMLVAAQLTLGFLVGLGIGMRVTKPGARGSGIRGL
jgi:hypothetical protein